MLMIHNNTHSTDSSTLFSEMEGDTNPDELDNYPLGSLYLIRPLPRLTRIPVMYWGYFCTVACRFERSRLDILTALAEVCPRYVGQFLSAELGKITGVYGVYPAEVGAGGGHTRGTGGVLLSRRTGGFSG